MTKTKQPATPTLASRWSPPVTAAGEAGQPIACLATTFTFHAELLERDLLPRFLGLKLDDAENEPAFVAEREHKLAMVYASVLVDQDHVDQRQTTLRWQQLPVRVPGGVQHAKVVVLVWQNCVRAVIGSANITRTGYRCNREIASCLDFYDHPASNPRRIILDVLDFLEAVASWVRATDDARGRLSGALRDTRERVTRWRQMFDDFTPQELPRVHFAPGLPARDGQPSYSPLRKALELWGKRKASEVVVMTPFVGDLSRPADPVIDELVKIERGRETVGRLIVPSGQSSAQDPARKVVGLPRRFLAAWAQAWRVAPEAVPVHVVALCRPHCSEKMNRDLHAKALFLAGENTSLLLCGSSNFSPHGMGIGPTNIEANLCFLARTDSTANGLGLRDRLLDGWEEDVTEGAVWPEDVSPATGGDMPAGIRLPDVFLWASGDPRNNMLTLGLDPTKTLPPVWCVRVPGAGAEELPPLVNQHQVPSVPADGRAPVALPDRLRGVMLPCVAVVWADDSGDYMATLPVQAPPDALPPPGEAVLLSVEAILHVLLTGRYPSGPGETSHATGSNRSPIHFVDTSGFALYRVRHLGRALAALGDRLLRTVRTRDAFAYRLRQDPLGPCQLADALLRRCREQGNNSDERAALLFSLAEVSLTVANVYRRLEADRHDGDPDLRPLFREVIDEIEAQGNAAVSAVTAANLLQYVAAVRQECQSLVRHASGGDSHAG